MATKTKPVVDSRTKSERCRDLLRSGKSIADLSHDKDLDMGYSFIFGVAKRAGLLDGHTTPKSAATVKVDREAKVVTIHPTDNPTMTITVDMTTGAVKTIRPKSK